jgi:hypothetical protein
MREAAVLLLTATFRARASGHSAGLRGLRGQDSTDARASATHTAVLPCQGAAGSELTRDAVPRAVLSVARRPELRRHRRRRGPAVEEPHPLATVPGASLRLPGDDSCGLAVLTVCLLACVFVRASVCVGVLLCLTLCCVRRCTCVCTCACVLCLSLDFYGSLFACV